MTNLACWAFALSLAAALAAGCNNVTYKDPTTIPSDISTETTGHFFLAGLVGHADVWADRSCPQGVATVHSEFSFVDELLTVVTLFIYTPRTYEVECAR